MFIDTESTMNKTELVSAVASKAQISQKEAKAVINTVIDVIGEQLANGTSVQIVGFGSFEVDHRAAKIGRNPSTGEKLTIAAHNVPKFKPGKVLKDTVNITTK